MAVGEMIGWLAAGLTLLAFSLRSVAALRIAAMGANVCFIIYAALTGLYPVLALHLLLLPCNIVRLRQLSSMAASTQPAGPANFTAAPARRHMPAKTILGRDRDWLILTPDYRHADTGRRFGEPSGGTRPAAIPLSSGA